MRIRPSLLGLLLTSFCLVAQGLEKPNILFIAIDDQRPEFGCYGSALAKTPNIDRFAIEAMMFERAYCQVPVCGASRASLLTGMLPTPDRFVDYDTRVEADAPGASTLPQVFREAGYTTVANGKVFHHRDDTRDRSWSELPWSAGSHMRSHDPETTQRLSKSRQRGRIFEAPQVDDDAYPDGEVVDKTLRDLRRLGEDGKPFFLACGFIRPHLPFYAPEKYWDLYQREQIPIASNRDRPGGAPKALRGSGEYRSYHLGDYEDQSDDFHRMMRHGYLASTSYVDKLVGELLAELERLQLARNTIVVLWGDHGFHLGEHNFWGKHNTMHLSTHIPLIVRVPGRKAGETTALVESSDIFPTLCELAGLDVPETVQGHSFSRLFDRPDQPFRRAVYSRFKSGDTIITRRFSYTSYNDGKSRMLYDLQNDPGENRNVAEQPRHARTLARMKGLLEQRIAERDSTGPLQLSGIYPHLAMFNSQRECGTGAVVPFANRLWVVTYGPHEPAGSDDKLYEITPDLEQIIRPESIGGTPANRMIHRESEQLFIGPYAIGADRSVRAIPYSEMHGRPTGNARHLLDPVGKIYSATMEEGLYEVDVNSLEVTELFRDTHLKGGRRMSLPGYHGKGLFSGQGVLTYANNGTNNRGRMEDPSIPSGVLATWDGKSDQWTVVRRNQFTEVTGPGGIHGAENPETDPVWSIGWDHRSLILATLHHGHWHYHRLPKSSHSYDGAHGWNTEWPRIRGIGEGNDLLMTMHGTFWKFPKSFTPEDSAGIIPRSNYLKVLGDFAMWNGKLVLGCNDTAASEFANKRRAKGRIAAPQSQSNLMFIDREQLDHFGPVIGRGTLWHGDPVKADEPTDPYLFAGYHHRALYLSHDTDRTVDITIEIDGQGDDTWEVLATHRVEAGDTLFHPFPPDQAGVWLRLSSSSDLNEATASLHYRNPDTRDSTAAPLFAGLARPGDPSTSGTIRARSGNLRTLAFVAEDERGESIGYYELDKTLTLARVDDEKAAAYHSKHTAIPDHEGILETDAASVIFIDEDGSRWRLPKGDPDFGSEPDYRIAREVATERDMFHAQGTFYELPAINAGGIPKLRPIATHPFTVRDFCSYRGLVILSGISRDAPKDNPHVIHSSDGRTALWAGSVEDLWKLGKPRGKGGPWLDTPIDADQVSDPYLLTGYDRKLLILTSTKAATITAEVDLTGDGDWHGYKSFSLKAGEALRHQFHPAFSAYWIRFTSDASTKATAQLEFN